MSPRISTTALSADCSGSAWVRDPLLAVIARNDATSRNADPTSALARSLGDTPRRHRLDPPGGGAEESNGGVLSAACCGCAATRTNDRLQCEQRTRLPRNSAAARNFFPQKTQLNVIDIAIVHRGLICGLKTTPLSCWRRHLSNGGSKQNTAPSEGVYPNEAREYTRLVSGVVDACKAHQSRCGYPAPL